MKLRHPFWISLAAFLASLMLRIWSRSLRYEVHGDQAHPTDPRKQRYIYLFWHDSLLAPATHAQHKVNVLISHHADGELIARVCQFLGHGVIRGSTNRGGTEALLKLIRSREMGHVAITPDGPRGPRRQLQLGAVLLASSTGLPIVPIGIGYSRAWRARSWDRFGIPQPFSTITAVIPEPMEIPQNLNKKGLEQQRHRVEARLLEATLAAERLGSRRGGTETSENSQPPAMESHSLLNSNAVQTKVPNLKKTA